MKPITTGGDLIAAASSARPGPTTPSQTSPASRSSAAPSSAASSTNTSGPHRKPGQDRWPSSGTLQANATIGRAIRLGALNAFGLRPHELDQATQGTPAKYTACIAENEEESP